MKAQLAAHQRLFKKTPQQQTQTSRETLYCPGVVKTESKLFTRAEPFIWPLLIMQRPFHVCQSNQTPGIKCDLLVYFSCVCNPSCPLCRLLYTRSGEWSDGTVPIMATTAAGFTYIALLVVSVAVERLQGCKVLTLLGDALASRRRFVCKHCALLRPSGVGRLPRGPRAAAEFALAP